MKITHSQEKAEKVFDKYSEKWDKRENPVVL